MKEVIARCVMAYVVVSIPLWYALCRTMHIEGIGKNVAVFFAVMSAVSLVHSIYCQVVAAMGMYVIDVISKQRKGYGLTLLERIVLIWWRRWQTFE